MKRSLKATLGLAALVALALSLSACSGTFSIWFSSSTPTVSGKIVDVRNAATDFTGTTVTLTNTSTGKQYTATVSGSSWSVSDPNNGTYSVSASNGKNYFFASSGADVTFSGSSVSAAPIAGVYTPPLYHSTYSDIVVFLMWNNTNQLNLDFSGPDGSYNNGGVATPIDFTDPSYDLNYNTSTLPSIWNNGFGPNGSISSSTNTVSPTGRIMINTTTKTIPANSTAPDMELTTNSTTGYGPDAILIKNYITGTSNGVSVSQNSHNQLAYADTSWQGVGIFYIDAPTSGQYISTTAAGTTAATSTDATIYAVDANSDGSAHIMGIYKAPTNTNAQTIAALRMNILNLEFQLVPQMATVAWGDIRTVSAPSGVVSAKRGPSN